MTEPVTSVVESLPVNDPTNVICGFATGVEIRMSTKTDESAIG